MGKGEVLSILIPLEFSTPSTWVSVECNPLKISPGKGEGTENLRSSKIDCGREEEGEGKEGEES